jgi:hypothetical protein
MASIISAGTTSATALNMSADTTGILQLASNNGTVAVTVTAGQDIGFGTASPTSKVQVVGSVLATGSGSAFRVNEDGIGTKIISIRSDFAGVGPTINVQTSDPLIFNTANTERTRITPTGDTLMGSSTSVGGRLQITSDSTRMLSNGNGQYRVFNQVVQKASNTTSACAITFASQGSAHTSHIVEIFFAAAQDDANGGVGGTATYILGSLTGVGTLSEIQDLGTGVSFAGSVSGSVLTVTATMTSNRNVVAWTVKVTSTYSVGAPTSISVT